jgi:hypothetical protein
MKELWNEGILLLPEFGIPGLNNPVREALLLGRVMSSK